MSQNRFPEGWNEDKLQKVISHYDKQTEEDAVVEDETDTASSETVMRVPHSLVAKVRELIAKHQR